MGLGPFDLTGPPFLLLYAALFLLSIIASVTIAQKMRAPGRAQEISDPDQLAWLTRGPQGFVDALITRLLVRADLILVDRMKFAPRPGAQGATAAEMAALAIKSTVSWQVLNANLQGYASMTERKLIQLGLVRDQNEVTDTRFWQTLPFVLLAGFGAIKVIIGDLRDKPVGILLGFIAITFAVALFRWLKVDRRTKAAIVAVNAARKRHERLQRAPTRDEIPLAVALFGTSVLAASAWGDYHRLRSTGGSGSSSASDSGGDSGSSGGGGSGCGGGGCGGCGGS